MKLLLTTIGDKCPRTDLALRYLYGVIADAPLETTLRTFPDTCPDGEIYDEIVRGRYNLVYLHCNEKNEYRITNLAEMIKKAVPSIAVIAGGMQVSFDTGYFMRKNSWVDYVIRGEGESVFYNFIKTLVSYEFDFENIPGLAYRNAEDIIVNDYDIPVDMDELPFPYEKTELTGKVAYYESIRGSSDRTLYYQSLPDASVRAASLNKVCTELRYFLVKGVDKVVFLDRWFNYNTERAYRLFEYIINNDNGKTAFEFRIDGDNIDEETVRLLSEAREGLFIFDIDVASTNAETLAAIGRRENIYQLMYNVTKLLQSCDIEVNINITVGLPTETEALFARSFNKAYGLAEGSPVHINTLRLPKGTMLRKESSKYGYLFMNNPPYEVIATDRMPAPDLIKIKMISNVVENYLGDGGFKSSVPRMLNDTGMKPYDLFSRLTEYIYSNGWEKKLRKKENLARIMYSFATGMYDEMDDTLKLQILQEVIHEDMETALNEDLLKKFERKGWDIEF